MFVHAGRLVRTALLALLFTTAAAVPAASLSPAATRPADVTNVATPAPKAPSRGVAVIYQVAGSSWYRVHNALLLEEKDGVGIKIAHVASWPSNTNKPAVQEFWVCKNPQGPGCPTPRMPNWRLHSYIEYARQPCPVSGGVTYCPGPFIAFKTSGHRPHNGAFACWRPANSTTCSKAWPGDNKILNKKGMLRYVHYVNPNPPAPGLGSYATSPGQFKFRVGAVADTVSAQRLCYLRGSTC
ncbi:hypothetical protein ACWDFL_34590 [Streptomyces bungoensis]